MAAVRLSVRPLFPSPCGQPVGRAVVGGRGVRPRGVPETSGRAAVSRPVSTALRRQGRVVAQAADPRHPRPRLRHEAHRRGAASAASRPPQARAPTVVVVRLPAPPPADRSVQRLIQRRRWTAPANRWAARRRSGPPSARQRARTAAAPCLHRSAPPGAPGKHQRRCALPVLLLPLSPYTHSRGLCGSLPLLEVSGCAAPATGPLRAFLPPCKRLECTAAGLLRQDPASRRTPAKTAPTDEPPAQAGGRARHASVRAGCGRRP
jgi:hypothetical protein